VFGTKSGAGAAPTLALPDKPSIAVLPFQNMSGDSEQEYFADGMAEEVMTALSDASASSRRRPHTGIFPRLGRELCPPRAAEARAMLRRDPRERWRHSPLRS
jgi:hypothetical protein